MSHGCLQLMGVSNNYISLTTKAHISDRLSIKPVASYMIATLLVRLFHESLVLCSDLSTRMTQLGLHNLVLMNLSS
jgi:hypothetical protein